MSDMATIEAGLRTLVVALTGLPDAMVVWENRKRPNIDVRTRAICLLSLGATATYGRDETVLEFFTGPGVFQETARGMRTLPLRLKVQCFKQTDAENASVYLERARTRLAWEDSIWALNAIDCSKQVTGTVIPLDFSFDDRLASMAALDITLNAELDETNPNVIPYIDDVIGTGTIGETATNYELVIDS